MRNQATTVTASIALSMIFIFGCDNFETNKRGSWEHYSAGGMLPVGTPALTDERHLYFVSGATGHGDVYSYELTSSHLNRITANAAFEGNPVPASGNNKLYFSRESNGRATVFALDINSGNQWQVTKGANDEEPIAILKNDSFLLSLRKQSQWGGHGQIGSFWLYSLSTAKTNPRRVGDYAVSNSIGTHVVALDDNELWLLYGEDFENKTPILAPFSGVPMTISNTGTILVLAKRSTGVKWELDSELYLFNLESKSIEAIGKGHSAVIDPIGAYIVFLSGYDNLVTAYETATRKSTTIWVEASNKSNLRRAANGNSRVFASIKDNRAENYVIYEVPFDSLQPKRIFEVNSDAICKEFATRK